MTVLTHLGRRSLGHVVELARRGRDLARSRGGDAGMTTAEYAVGTIAACTFALVLIGIVKSGPIRAALVRVITTALGIAG